MSTVDAMRYFARAGLTELGLGDNVLSGIAAATGTAINPHATAVFEGVNLRNHSFTWDLSPKSPDESTTVKNIIGEFRKASLPSYTNPVGAVGDTTTSWGRALFQYPSMVDIFFVGLNQEYYFYFKTCMITNIGVDYSPHGNAMFKDLQGSRPVFMNLRLDLMESQIHTKEDYATGSSTLVPTTTPHSEAF